MPHNPLSRASDNHKRETKGLFLARIALADATPARRLLRPALVGQNRKGDHDGRHLKEGRADHQKPEFMLRLRVHGVITPKALDRSGPTPRRATKPRYDLRARSTPVPGTEAIFRQYALV